MSDMAPNYVMKMSTQTPDAIADRKAMEQARKEKELCFRLKKRIRSWFAKKEKATKLTKANNTTVEEVEPQVQPATPVLRPQTASTLDGTEPFPLLSAADDVRVTSRPLSYEEARADGARAPIHQNATTGNEASNAAGLALSRPTIQIDGPAEETKASQPVTEQK